MVIGELIRKEENVQRLETKREFKLIELCWQDWQCPNSIY
jgi:hypothetical protein